jgi:hypothetical protein
MSAREATAILADAMPARSDQRYVLAVGRVSDEVAALEGVQLLKRLDQVVLVRTSLSTAAQLRRMKRPHIHIYTSEKGARTAFSLFQSDRTGRANTSRRDD